MSTNPNTLDPRIKNFLNRKNPNDVAIQNALAKAKQSTPEEAEKPTGTTTAPMAMPEPVSVPESVQEAPQPVQQPMAHIVPSFCIPTEAEVKQIIKGSVLEPLCDIFAMPSVKPLPFGMCLAKSYAIAGMYLSGPNTDYMTINSNAERGSVYLKVGIATGGTRNACNVFALIVMASGEGKDIGGLIANLSGDLMLSNIASSGEGWLDDLTTAGNGLILMGEMKTFLNKKSYAGQALSILTDLFGRGWAKASLAKGKNSVERFVRFAYPSILANVQPEILNRLLDADMVDDGFMPRFLIFPCASVGIADPLTRELSNELYLIKSAVIEPLQNMVGTVIVPPSYLGSLRTHMEDKQRRSHAARLVNEYGPKFALMTSIEPNATNLPASLPLTTQDGTKQND